MIRLLLASVLCLSACAHSAEPMLDVIGGQIWWGNDTQVLTGEEEQLFKEGSLNLSLSSSNGPGWQTLNVFVATTKPEVLPSYGYIDFVSFQDYDLSTLNRYSPNQGHISMAWLDGEEMSRDFRDDLKLSAGAHRIQWESLGRYANTFVGVIVPEPGADLLAVVSILASIFIFLLVSRSK